MPIVLWKDDGNKYNAGQSSQSMPCISNSKQTLPVSRKVGLLLIGSKKILRDDSFVDLKIKEWAFMLISTYNVLEEELKDFSRSRLSG